MIFRTFFYRSDAWATPVKRTLSRTLCSINASDGGKKEPYFITTPIFYVNSVPHIGHLYTAVVADALARWHRLQGHAVVFSTGTDEHGTKIQRAAAHHGIEPKTFCDKNAGQFKRLFDAAGVAYTDFIRTTDERHVKSVHTLWKTLESRGYIYKGQYEGWYSIQDEAFHTDLDIEVVTQPDGSQVKVSKESGHLVGWLSEENYMFRLSEFVEPLQKWLDQKVIKPSHPFEGIVRTMLSHDLGDLSVSRQRDRLNWGIPVPGDDTQTIYVWLDALTNYLTVAGYPDNPMTWPAQCHLVGKDIIKFHAIYWPAFLMAAGLELPESIYCHAHWLKDYKKMSKSVGNVVDPFQCIDQYGETAIRYYLLGEGVPHSDGNFNEENILRDFNTELVNTLANLLSRSRGKKINPRGVIPVFHEEEFNQRASWSDKEMWMNLDKLPDLMSQHFENYEIHKAIQALMSQLRDTNHFFSIYEPWHLVGQEAHKKWLDTILHICLTTVRISTILLQPIVPNLSCKVLDSMCVDKSKRTWKHAVKDKQHEDSPLGEHKIVVQRLASK